MLLLGYPGFLLSCFYAVANVPRLVSWVLLG